MMIRRVVLPGLVATVLLLVAGLAPQAPGVAKAPPPGEAGTGVQAANLAWRGELRLSDPVSPEIVRHGGEVAYDPEHRQFLVVWYNQWSPDFSDIYARRVTWDGQHKGSVLTVASGANGDGKARSFPAVAYSAWSHQFLVVYMYDALGDGLHWEVWGRLVAWDGSWLGDEFQILAWANRAFWNPRVVWNGFHMEYLVVANAKDTVSGLWNDVAGRRVMDNGMTPYPGRAISPQSQTLQPSHADVAYCPGTDEYLVVWRGTRTPGDGDIFGDRLQGADASLIDPPGEFLIDESLVDQRFPTVATDQKDRFLVVWQQLDEQATPRWDIWGLWMAGGNLEYPSFPIANNAADNERYPNVAIDSSRALRRFVVWWRTTLDGKEDIWGFDWSPSVQLLAWRPYKVVGNVEPSPPAIAEGEGAFLIVYEMGGADWVHIYGRVLPRRAYLPMVFH